MNFSTTLLHCCQCNDSQFERQHIWRPDRVSFENILLSICFVWLDSGKLNRFHILVQIFDQIYCNLKASILWGLFCVFEQAVIHFYSENFHDALIIGEKVCIWFRQDRAIKLKIKWFFLFAKKAEPVDGGVDEFRFLAWILRNTSTWRIE
jgi:hypothetical protein